MKHGTARYGLTLVETLVASVILSATVVTVSALSSKCMFGTGTNRAYELAASMVDRQLTLIDSVGIDAFMEAGQTQGEFGEIAPDYSWTLFAEPLGVDNLQDVTLTVFWVARGGIKSLSVTTRLNGQSVLASGAL
jgi:hypothetical protein